MEGAQRIHAGDQYFAELPTTEIGHAVEERVRRYYRQIESIGIFNIMRKSYFAYYGSSYEGSTGKLFNAAWINRSGVQGEEYDIKINGLRTAAQHLLVLATSEKAAYEAMAENTDSESQQQAELAEGLVENFDTEKRLERAKIKAAETALVLGGGYYIQGWDPSLGRLYATDPETGTPIHEGDLIHYNATPLDIIMDPAAKTPDTNWKIHRRAVSKWDVAAQNAELRDEILNTQEACRDIDRFRFLKTTEMMDSDEIHVYDLYHAKTPAVPDGRMVTVVPGGHVLYDGPLPYDEVPIYHLQPYNITDTAFGYTPVFDALAIQDGIDILTSSILTNQAAFGKQLLWLPKGHDMKYTQLSKALAVVESDPKLGPPQGINLTQTPPEIFNFVGSLMEWQKERLGLNSVVTGNPQGQLSGASGAAMALLASQAIQFANGFQREWEYFNDDTATGLVKVLQAYASTPRVAQIVGKSKRSYMKAFKGDDIGRVLKVRMKRTSAISKTTSGKMTLADNLLERGSIDANQYINLVRTGQLDTMTDAPMSKMILIKAENEVLRDGGSSPVLRTDIHELHIDEHLTVLDDPDVRANPNIVNAVLAHVQEHETYLQPPMPAMAPGGLPPQPDNAGGPPMDPNAPAPDQMQAPMGAEGLQEAMPSQPGLPQNPLTGEQFVPATEQGE